MINVQNQANDNVGAKVGFGHATRLRVRICTVLRPVLKVMHVPVGELWKPKFWEKFREIDMVRKQSLPF